MRRAQRRKHHYFYKTTCLITNRYYYGIHSTDNLDDGYIGSGKKLWYSINKYGRENHKIEILEFFDTRENLKKREKEVVNENLLKDPMCMNLQVGGVGGFSSKEHAKKFHAAGGRVAGKINAPLLHKRLKEDIEYRKKWCKSQSLSQRGKKHKSPLPEAIERCKNIYKRINHQQGIKNSQYGTKWITNGIKSTKVKKDDVIPIGWTLGRKINK